MPGTLVLDCSLVVRYTRVMDETMSALDEMLNMVSLMTGVKNEFVAQGWSEQAAEHMVISLLGVVAAAGSQSPEG